MSGPFDPTTYDPAWINTLCATWAGVSDGKFGTIKKSYNLVTDTTVPEKLEDFPCCITYPPTLDNPDYSMGGGTQLTWRGMTVFHLSPNLAKSNMPLIFPYMIRILGTAAKNVGLGFTNGSTFFISRQPGAIAPMENLKFGGEEPHYGILVNWIFNETLSDTQVTVSY